MGFSKERYEPEVSIEVRHVWHPGTAFVFHFPKVLPQAALEAQKTFLGLSQEETEEALRLALINVVAEMVTRLPEGFDDLTQGDKATVSLAMRAYFNDPTKPELAQIITAAWGAYKAAANPAAYLKSFPDHLSGSSQPASVSKQAES